MVYLKLNAEHMQYLISVKHVFVNAQTITGVPWQALAGIWYRESFSVSSPHTPGGPMQFDPPLTETQIMRLLLHYTKLDGPVVKAFAMKGSNDFATAVLCAACFLKYKMNGENMTNDNQVMEAMWRYNGIVGNKPEDSSYVYNGFDEAHTAMSFQGTEPGPNNTRHPIHIIDHRPGAYTVYTQLIQENK
jgi:hypothetical protein